MSDLTKWPRLLVRGERITEAQADEVLIRTCVPSYIFGNDKAWARAVYMVMGLVDDTPPDELWRQDRYDERIAWLKERWAHNRKRTDELGIIPLNYLYNSRIASSWIGGPHGWCDWDGTIACWTHNVGKWPTFDDVTEEWTLIAEAFPFLDLTAQLLINEGGYEIDEVEYPGELCGEWRVKDGTVTADEDPTERLYDEATVRGGSQSVLNGLNSLFNPNRERGVTIERLVQAVKRVDGS